MKFDLNDIHYIKIFLSFIYQTPYGFFGVIYFLYFKPEGLIDNLNEVFHIGNSEQISRTKFLNSFFQEYSLSNTAKSWAGF